MVVQLQWDLNSIELIEGDTFLRIRLSTDLDSLQPDINSSKDGEVEDHTVQVSRESNIAIERIDSGSSSTIKDRRSLYTQIVNQEFDYSIVFYKDDLIEETAVDVDTVVKVELIDKTINKMIAIDHVYIRKSDKRVNRKIITSEASKNAIFRVTFLKNLSRIANIDCTDYGSDLKGCYNSSSSIYNEHGFKIAESNDSFAIRPKYFNIDLNIKVDLWEMRSYVSGELMTYNNLIYECAPASLGASIHKQKWCGLYAPGTNGWTLGWVKIGKIKLISGKDYNVTIKAIKANEDKTKPEDSIVKSFNSIESRMLLEFAGSEKCANKDNQTDKKLLFIEGEAKNKSFSSLEVGSYKFVIRDINWTEIDQDNNGSGCILDSSSNKKVDGKYGCNIIDDENISFQIEPDRFEFEMTHDNNLHSTKKTIYMEDINDNIKNSEGFMMKGKVISLGKNGGRLDNYTDECVAKDINVSLDINITLSEDLTSPETIYGSPLKYDIILDLNNTLKNVEGLDLNESLGMWNKNIFKEKGEGNFSILINIKKNRLEKTNPVVIDFNKLFVKSGPVKGSSSLDTKMIFLYTAIIPDQYNYDTVYFNSGMTDNSLLTPMTAVGFCNDISFLTKAHLSINQHKTSEGNWFVLYDVIGKPVKLITTNTNISFSDGEEPEFDKGSINYNTEYKGTDSIEGEIIKFNFNKPSFDYINSYKVSFQKQEKDSFKGSGRLGNTIEDTILETVPNKID